MARISAQDCIERIPSHFAICILAAQRARDLAAGRPPLVVCDNKPAVTALREIAAGKVSFNESVDSVLEAHVSEMKALDGTRGRVRTASRAKRSGPT